MKEQRFKLCVCNENGKFLRFCPFEVIDKLCKKRLPNPFTFEDAKDYPALSDNIKNKLKQARPGAKIRIQKLGTWDRAAHRAEFLYIMCIENTDYKKKRLKRVKQLKYDLDEIDELIEQAAGNLINKKERLRKKLKNLTWKMKHETT